MSSVRTEFDSSPNNVNLFLIIIWLDRHHTLSLSGALKGWELGTLVVTVPTDELKFHADELLARQQD